MEKSIREEYEINGVEEYYKHLSNYVNPHINQITELLTRNINRVNPTRVLDLCCGGGEVTSILLNNDINNVIGSDEYTMENYVKNTKKDCFRLSFKDIMADRLEGYFSTIICSFALHLVKEKDLKMLISKLFLHTNKLIVISPHKRPFIDRVEGVYLTHLDFVKTYKGKKVYLKIYRNLYKAYLNK